MDGYSCFLVVRLLASATFWYIVVENYDGPSNLVPTTRLTLVMVITPISAWILGCFSYFLVPPIVWINTKIVWVAC
ncbi:hypothetical protein K402DRAFT_424140 [Aulographum hederae CBS 113979]|uniref:Uncharacterized protein n=1 Tax=Aulographum hederae CBS 113979 TaxID=1176131 RepID=A0A6G1GPP2_9PEZI|nr:hypothetical protein K402DRAFT_424140 [Aulographum hederae CBS 113979]